MDNRQQSIRQHDDRMRNGDPQKCDPQRHYPQKRNLQKRSPWKHSVILTVLLLLAGCGLLLAGCSDYTEFSDPGAGTTGILSSTEDIGLRDIDDGGMNYAFTYDGEDFSAQYIYDNWTVFDSYKITNEDDMKIICQALIDTHTVHGKDLESFRTADDMAYEWQQHNIAYAYLPEDNAWREHAKNVDFDPADQGRSFQEIYEDRTGEELDISEKIKEELEEGDILEKLKEYLDE